MPENFLQADVPRVTTTTARIDYDLFAMNVIRGDADSPGSVELILRAQDNQNRWREDVPPLTVLIKDDPTMPAGQKQLGADVRAAYMNAIVPTNAKTTAWGVAGLPFKDALR